MGPLVLTWAGGEHAFLLDLGGLRALQERCDAGPEQIYHRLAGNEWRVDEVLEVLRLGLAGGGMDPAEAKRLVARISDTTPLLRLRPIAQAVIAAALVGPADDPLGEPEGATPPPPENGRSAPSTAAAR